MSDKPRKPLSNALAFIILIGCVIVFTYFTTRPLHTNLIKIATTLYQRAFSVSKDEPDKPYIPKWGTLTVERLWTERQFDRVLVHYKNNTDKTFYSVDFTCKTFDEYGNSLNLETDSFHSLDYGPIGPGFEGDKKLMIPVAPTVSIRVTCKINNGNFKR